MSQSVSSQGKPRGRLRCGRRARLEDLKTASREGGEAWKTSKESGDIAHLTSPFSDPTLTRWGQRSQKGGEDDMGMTEDQASEDPG